MIAPYRFGRFEVNPTARQLLADGKALVLGARAFDVLLALIERREQLVTKNELLDLVWPGLVVEENNLQVQISSLRKLLGPQSIATIPGRGYRFTCGLDNYAASLPDKTTVSDAKDANNTFNAAKSLDAGSNATPGSQHALSSSQTVYDAADGEAPMQASSVGPRSFENSAQPVPISDPVTERTAVQAESGVPVVRSATQRSHAKRWTTSALSVALLLSLAAGGWFFWSGRNAPSSPSVAKAQPALADGKSVAVLPFTNMSDNKENAYFADGMQEELLTQLALLGELKVVSRTSVMDYRDTKKNARQIGTELGVRTLVEGSVRRAGDVVRVSVQLIDASSDKHLWGQSYERKLKDIFAIQNELATEIARALKVSLSPQVEKRLARVPTENVAAYDLYLRHQELVNSSMGTFRSRSSVKERIALLSEAVKLDPQFALAWAKLGAEHARAYDLVIDRSPSRLTKARQAIERALELTPDDIEVQIEEGTFYQYGSHDNARAARSFEEVLRIAPNNVDARLQLANIRYRELNYAEVVTQLENVLAIDARNVSALTSYGTLLIQFRHFDRALAVQQQLINIRPDDVDLQGKYQSIEHSKTGAWDSFDRWRSSLPTGMQRTSGRVWFLDRNRAIARRDFDGLIRLLDAVPNEAQTVESVKLGYRLWKSVALLARGDRAQGLAVARTVLAQTTNELRNKPDDPALLEWSWYAHAILGLREAALADLRRAHASALASKDFSHADDVYREILDLRALLGDREQALQELSRQLKLPRSLASYFRVDLALHSLWDDPRFLAIVNDPANNAPIPFDVKQTRTKVQ